MFQITYVDNLCCSLHVLDTKCCKEWMGPLFKNIVYYFKYL